ncbi:hypothetical protein B484DRAFT_456756 [Ochromonadaceae sp. CCMP2298]|nr:hypothetical protein B484DRAFT_456756 [Ochromonadaceae sp. CCMP2298]
MMLLVWRVRWYDVSCGGRVSAKPSPTTSLYGKPRPPSTQQHDLHTFESGTWERERLPLPSKTRDPTPSPTLPSILQSQSAHAAVSSNAGNCCGYC